MATTLLSVDDYLKLSTSPDCEYVRGEIKERAVPERDHTMWQKALMLLFANHEREWGIEVLTELRVQVARDNFRVPDVTILSRTAPREQIITQPPLAVFEILSPSDSMTEILDKLADYDQMGIPAIWVIEPKKQVYYRCSSGQLTPSTTFDLPGAAHSVPMAEIAALLD